MTTPADVVDAAVELVRDWQDDSATPGTARERGGGDAD